MGSSEAGVLVAISFLLGSSLHSGHSGLSTLSGWLFPSFSLLVPAHVPVFVHISLHQIGHLHRVDFATLAVADLKREHNHPNALSLSETNPARGPCPGPLHQGRWSC